MAINFLLTNVYVVPTAVGHVLSKQDASASDMAGALSFGLWVVSLCPLYCGAGWLSTGNPGSTSAPLLTGLRFATNLRLLPVAWLACLG